MKLFEVASFNVCAVECIEIILQLIFGKVTMKVTMRADGFHNLWLPFLVENIKNESFYLFL
jgi:hypothetical protein